MVDSGGHREAVGVGDGARPDDQLRQGHVKEGVDRGAVQRDSQNVVGRGRRRSGTIQRQGGAARSRVRHP